MEKSTRYCVPVTALEGIRVLDVSQVMAGPYCTMMLADLGADVIKVEPPAGDSTRRWAGTEGTDSAGFNAVNRGKRGIVLNLKEPQARGVFRRLARDADIVVENYRPGVMAAFELDYPRLSAVNPRVIYASISGYGQTGPAAAKGGFDLIAQAVSGIMSVTGEPAGPPVKAGIPITDLGAALFALSGILAALYHRTRTGHGQYIDTSLLEAGIALSVWEATEYFAGSGIPRPVGSAHRLSAPYQAIRCADGFIVIGAANDRLFRRLCELLDHPEWIADPEFRDDTARVRHRDRLVSLIERETTGRSRHHWLTVLEANDIPCGPINTYEDTFRDEHVRSRQMVVETDHPTLGRIPTLGSPLKMSGTPATPGRRGPLLGEHTSEVLREAGYTDEELNGLRAAGAIA